MTVRDLVAVSGMAGRRALSGVLQAPLRQAAAQSVQRCRAVTAAGLAAPLCAGARRWLSCVRVLCMCPGRTRHLLHLPSCFLLPASCFLLPAHPAHLCVRGPAASAGAARWRSCDPRRVLCAGALPRRPRGEEEGYMARGAGGSGSRLLRYLARPSLASLVPCATRRGRRMRTTTA